MLSIILYSADVSDVEVAINAPPFAHSDGTPINHSCDDDVNEIEQSTLPYWD